MATQVNVTFEGGSAGDTISTSNSPGVASVGGNTGGNTAVLNAADAAHGSLGTRFTTVAGGNTAGTFITVNYPTTSAQQTFSEVLRTPNALPGADMTLLSWRDSSNGTIIRFFVRQSDGGLYFADAGGNYTQVVAGGAWKLNTQYRLTLTATVGTTTGNGSFTAKFRLQSSQALVGSQPSVTTSNLGTAGFYRVVIGIVGNVLGYNVGADDIQLNSGTTAEIGDYAVVTNSVPTARFTYTKSNLTVNVDASASTDSDGTVTGYGWNFGDGSGTQAVGVTATHSYSAAGTYTITLAVADNSGASGTTTQSVTVSATAPVGVANLYIAQVLIDMSSSTGQNALSWSISPVPADLVHPNNDPALFLFGTSSSDRSFTITTTDTSSGLTDTDVVSVPAAAAQSLTETVVYKNGQWT